MNKYNRRTLIKAMAATGVAIPVTASLHGCVTTPCNDSGHLNTAGSQPRVVVIGGGFGGASVAKYLNRFDSNISVTLVEPKTTYMTCPGSNWYLAGLTDAETITHDYKALQKRGVKVIHEMVDQIDPKSNTVTLASGATLGYDRLVVSPGIDFKYEMIEGYSAEVAKKIPHAYKAGPQTELLYKQIREMKQGGTFVIAPPPNPFRCPPGPYERVSMVAAYFKEHNPTAKIMILDAKNKFSKMGLFKEGWEQLYGDMIEFIPAIDGGVVTKVDPETMTVFSDYENIKADVINLIPPQKAGALAFKAGLTNETGWCPVNQETFESTIHRGIHVIGDACIAGKMPKSGHSAASQGKMCAAAIVSQLHNWAMPRPKNVNTCYSLISKDYGISVAAVYEMHDGTIGSVKGSGGVSPMGSDSAFRKMEANYARGWYKSITSDLWHS